MKSVVLVLCVAATLSGQKLAVPDLLKLAHTPANPTFGPSLRETLTAKALAEGTAVVGQGADFLFATDAPSAPDLYIDDTRAGTLQALAGTQAWFTLVKMKPGTSHSFYYMVKGERMGGKNDIPAYLPDSYVQPGVPQGTLSEKMVHTSKIYDGMVSDWWIYAPAQYAAAKPAALMVWHDGRGWSAAPPRRMPSMFSITSRRRIRSR